MAIAIGRAESNGLDRWEDRLVRVSSRETIGLDVVSDAARIFVAAQSTKALVRLGSLGGGQAFRFHWDDAGSAGEISRRAQESPAFAAGSGDVLRERPGLTHLATDFHFESQSPC
jgi:hypothetical protein